MRTYFMRYRFTHPTTEDFLRTIEEVAIARGKALSTRPTSVILSGAKARTSSLPLSVIPQQPVQNPAASSEFEPSAVSLPTTPPLTPTGHPDYASAQATNSTLRPFFNQAIYGTQVLDYAIDSISSDPVQWWLPAPKDPRQIQYLDTVVLRRKDDFILPLTVEIIFTDGTRQREQWDGVDRWTKFTYTRNAKILSAEIDPDHTILLDKNLFNNSYTTEPNSIATRKLTNLWLSLHQLLAQLVAWIV
jgi:hypothetical protein